ncbi:MAG: hypothetical protein PHC97_04495 [Patescibacteria group bacterium]|nr:hypothetical protein [Patescibacteria group bacterium]
MLFLGIDWSKIFSAHFWLDVNPGELSDRFQQFFIAVLIVGYGIYLANRFWHKKLIAKREFIKANYFSKLGNFFLTMAVSFTFIFFFRYEAIPFLGGRFWVLIWILVGLGWLVYLVRYYFVHVKAQLRSLALKQKKNKYLK